ncbi:PREDICTED: uncharacterized protein LOC109462600 [Branchiostoma belcheri]|uniref:Uncharacterized protein LOC109462600 n=1 Tax=Branchiostoma belcheri TaxID=7741 RepID=A0A6P4YCT9_BRABE|nr:PREDICTED: uncharacterized protein LOC109462600 [Branchiostoma belcheri]
MARMILLLFVVLVGSAMANTRTCFCEIRTGIDRTSPEFMDVDDRIYDNFLVTCNYAKERCPDDCRSDAATELGGTVNPLDHNAGINACNELRREVTPDNPVHLYAHYSTSNCDQQGFHYLGELCCWELNFGPGFPLQYLYNPSCSVDQHPLTG